MLDFDLPIDTKSTKNKPCYLLVTLLDELLTEYDFTIYTTLDDVRWVIPPYSATQLMGVIKSTLLDIVQQKLMDAHAILKEFGYGMKVKVNYPISSVGSIAMVVTTPRGSLELKIF